VATRTSCLERAIQEVENLPKLVCPGVEIGNSVPGVQAFVLDVVAARFRSLSGDAGPGDPAGEARQ